MTEEKKDLVQELRKRRNTHSAITDWALIIGFMIMFAAMGVVIGQGWFGNDNHLSSPNIPLKDAKNATYTFTQHDWVDANTPLMIIMLGGLMIAIFGMGANLATPGLRTMHRIHCKGEGEKRYCPECGLELSQLEGK